MVGVAGEFVNSPLTKMPRAVYLNSDIDCDTEKTLLVACTEHFYSLYGRSMFFVCW